MRILFLHPNFPGQFKALAPFLSIKKHDVKFLCQTHYGREIPGVERLCLKGRASHNYLISKKLKGSKRNLVMAEQYATALKSLRMSKWKPEIIISHSGFGCGLYARAIFPNAKIICYLEWWFKEESDMFKYDELNEELKLNQGSILNIWTNNTTISTELLVSDAIVSPSNWQASQVPEKIRSMVEVINDGIDLSKFFIEKPTKNKDKYPVITYGTRGMEPIRCFPQFIRCIPKIIRKWPSVKIEIAGDDESFYTSSNPGKNTTWGKWAIDHLKNHGINEQVIWKGRLNEKDYIAWLKSSWCHVYLTHPFVTSWSLVEAYCAGCPIVTSNIEATKEFCDEQTTIYVDHRNDEEIIRGINFTLRNQEKICNRIAKNRRTNDYCKNITLEKWNNLILKLG